jgi:hypothetical protein
VRIFNLKLSSQMANLFAVAEFLTNFVGTLLAVISTTIIKSLFLGLSSPSMERKSCSGAHFLDDTLQAEGFH